MMKLAAVVTIVLVRRVMTHLRKLVPAPRKPAELKPWPAGWIQNVRSLAARAPYLAREKNAASEHWTYHHAQSPAARLAAKFGITPAKSVARPFQCEADSGPDERECEL